MTTDILFILIIGALVGASSGYLGSFMVLKRMSLVGDALSHVALPGIALALTFGINPMLGAFVFLDNTNNSTNPSYTLLNDSVFLYYLNADELA